MIEIFKPIAGYEGKYEVSNHGNVKSLLCRTSATPQILYIKPNAKGYKRVELSQPTGRFLVHRLVAQAFIDNPNGYPQVNHLDNNPSNNHESNLEWGTQSQNLVHAQKQGRLYLAQATGGYVTTNQNKAKAHQLALSLIGTTYHNWSVVDYAGVLLSGKSPREHVLCKCSCGTIQSIYYATILNSTASTGCFNCSKTSQSTLAKSTFISKHLSTVVGTWKVLEPINDSITTTIRKLKFSAECINCGNSTILTQPSISGLKPIKSCTSLKCKG